MDPGASCWDGCPTKARTLSECSLWDPPSAQDRAWHTEDSVNVVNKFKIFNICYGKSVTRARVKSLVAGWWGDLTDPGEGLG